MTQVIHNVEVFDEKRYVTDPQKGLVLTHNAVIKRGSVEAIAHAGETFHVQADGSFEVPDELAERLVKQPEWFEGSNPFQEDIEADVEAKNAPTKKRAQKRSE